MVRQLAFAITIIVAFSMAAAQQTRGASRAPETPNAPQGLEEQDQAYGDALTKKDRYSARYEVRGPGEQWRLPLHERVDQAAGPLAAPGQ
jgi:hypothetical protein